MREKTKTFVIYKRVSTRKQNDSGLGLEAQEKAVRDYLTGKPHEIVGEFTEVESGRKSKRPELDSALQCCRKHKATLVVARTDRLSRNVHFLSGLLEQKIEFVAVDNPTANNFTLHIMSAVAEQEALLISQRTKAALAAAKARGVKLGVTGKALAAKNRDRANRFAEKTADDLHAAVRFLGKHNRKISFSSIAARFNDLKLQTERGGDWHPMTIKRICERVGFSLESVT